MEQLNTEVKKNGSKGWIIFFVAVILIIAAGILVWYFVFYHPNKKQTTQSPSPSNEILQENSVEKWTRSPDVIFQNVTSTNTHKLADGVYRMYLMKEGEIVYSDSLDALNFGTPKQTGITESPGKMISNPAVIELKDKSYIMIYEEKPNRPGQEQNKGETPGPNTQRNLLLARSADGKTFEKTGIAIDSSKEDNYFASVPDLVELPDGKIRMYYVSGGQAIGSAISSDGISWTREPGFRLEDEAVDPDVMYKTINGKQKWVMYYSVLTGPGNKIYKSVSEDGLKWGTGQEAVFPTDKNSTIVDPDVVKIDNNKYRMYFGEARASETATEAPTEFNLYFADSDRDIFNY